MIPQTNGTMTETVPVTVDDPVMKSFLVRIEGRVNRSLDSLDRNISGAAKSLGSTGISGMQIMASWRTSLFFHRS